MSAHVPVVHLLVRLIAWPSRVGPLIEALHSVMRGVQREDGCSAVHVARDVDADEVVWYWEDWTTLAAYERYLRSDRFDRMLAVLETAAAPPQIEWRMVSETRGLPYVAAVRGIPTVDGEIQDNQGGR
jgi:quinol monooxygenase YgiN